MGKYFGTDGFRGEVGRVLTAYHAFQIGRYLGYLANGTSIVIGKDTRKSGDMLESALAAGITSSGTDCDLLGVVTTPGVAYITRECDYAFGIMVSASHNPFQDNGIKVLNANGEKLEENVITDIEAFIDGEKDIDGYATGASVGRIEESSVLCGIYESHLRYTTGDDFAGYKVALDCANGSASNIAGDVFKCLKADVSVFSCAPDGININVDCGSTHMETFCDIVTKGDFDIGFAYDGDADRCLAVDENGNVITGDHILYICGKHLKKQGRLASNTIVATIMSNLGLFKALDREGISYEKTKVGDKYVYENMAQNGHMLGGEQSGHIIFREFATTGDGILTSLMMMDALMASHKKASELSAGMTLYPQVLKNQKVDDKAAALADEMVQEAIEKASEALGDNGRMLVRESGTEPLLRVMAEAGSEEECEKYVDMVIEVLKSSGHAVL